MKKTYPFLGILVIVMIVMFPFRVNAQGLPFGGLVTFNIPCVCSTGMAVFFAPLYPNPPFPGTGGLHFIPGASFLHPHFLIGVPATWELGQYIAGTGACFVGIPPECVIVPTLGTMVRVGTSGL